MSAYFFAFAESSTIAAQRVFISHLSAEGDRRAKIIEAFKSNPRRFFGTTLVGTNICIVVLSSVGAHYLLPRLGMESIVLATILVDILILVTAEITPKTLSLSKPTHSSLKISLALERVARIFEPIVAILMWIPSRFLNIDKVFNNASKIALTESEIVHMIGLGAKQGSIDESEGERAVRVFETADKTVDEIMTPRSDLVSLESGDNLKVALHLCNESGFSRIPVMTKDGDDTIGFISAKDLLKVNRDGKLNEPVDKYVRKIMVVPESKKILMLLDEFRNRGEQIALVVNEHGTITGLISLEDILEEVLGEIYDEYDTYDEEIHWSRGSMIIPGGLPIDDLEEALNMEIPEGDYDTAAGLMLHLMDKIPAAGESVEFGEWVLTASAIEKNRIMRISAKKK